MSTVLKDEDVRRALEALPGWNLSGATIERSYQFENFAEAMVFVNRVAELAEEADHHPDIAINYNRVKLSLTSHDSGGITRRDIKMATAINNL